MTPLFRLRALACLGGESEVRALVDRLPDLDFRLEELYAHGLVALGDSIARARLEKPDIGSRATYYRAQALIRAGMLQEAHDFHVAWLESAGPGWRASLLGTLGTVKATLGDDEGARALLRELTQFPQEREADPYGNAPFAEVHLAAALGEHEYAVEVILEKLAAGRRSLFYGSPSHGGRAYWYDFHYGYGTPGWERLMQDPRVRPLLHSRD